MSQEKNIQLFLLPFAGGNASSFQNLEKELAPNIESISIEYSGRGSRLSEGYITEYDVFFNDIVKYIKARRNTSIPYALFGYSMGASFAYELTSKCVLDEEPTHIFYGARECISTHQLRGMSDDDFVEYAKTLGGIPEGVINSRLFKLFVHPLKDDYLIAQQYIFKENIKPNCDITVFYSQADTPYEKIEGWKDLTHGNTSFYEFGQNHFFIKDRYCEIAEIINGILS